MQTLSRCCASGAVTLLTGLAALSTSVAKEGAPASTLCRPALSSPAAGAVLPQRRIPGGKFKSVWSFAWTACPGVTRYHLYVIGPGAQNPVVNANELRGTAYTDRTEHYGVTNLEGWSWKVRAGFGEDWGDWSETRMFNVNSTTDAVALGVCSISGRIHGDQPAYETRIELLTEPDHVRIDQTRVTARGDYRFDNVPEDSYVLVPKGKYPADAQLGVGPSPPSARITCRPNTRQHQDFAIRSTEG